MARALTQDAFLAAIAPTIDRQPLKSAGAFGPLRRDDIAAHIYGYCVSDLGAPPSGVLFFGVSVGAVLGIRLADGCEVAIKARYGVDLAHLTRAYDLQEELRRKGIPCAELWRPPRETMPRLSFVTHRLFAPGSQARLSPAIRRAIAEEYWRITMLAEQCDPAGLTSRELVMTSDLFDHFPGLREELDDLHLHGGKVIAHTDWKIRNLLFHKNKVSAAFDFDALYLVDEMRAIASTALNFMRVRGPSTIDLYPGETHGFLGDYEQIRGKAFSLEEVRRVRLWSLYDMIFRTWFPAYRRVPVGFLYERIKRFDRAVGDLWPVWRKAGRG